MHPNRKSLSKKLRFSILSRDEYTCRYCGATLDSGALLVVDHIQPVALGGTNDPTNLITACQPCNAGKGARSPDSSAPTEKDRLRLLQEMREQEAAAEAVRLTIQARERQRQELCNLWCEIREVERCEEKTVDSLVHWVGEFGVATVAVWIHIADRKMGHRAEYSLCKYIGGIARQVRLRAQEQKAKSQPSGELGYAIPEYAREPTIDDR